MHYIGVSGSGEDLHMAASEGEFISLAELDVGRGARDCRDGRETGGEGSLQLSAARDVVGVHMRVQAVLERQSELRNQSRVSRKGKEKNESMKV